jgi:hypothetical protein
MAHIDEKCLLSEDVALPSSATTEYSTNEIHFEAGKNAWGVTLATPNAPHGTPLYLNFVMNTVASTGSSPTLTLNVVAATTTAPTTVVQIICSAVAAATLVAGYKISCALQDFPAWPVYLRLQVVAGTAGFSTGTYTAWISTVPLSDY